MPSSLHKHHKIENVSCAVITASDSRTVETDIGGKLICDRLESAGHSVFAYNIIPDEPELISRRLLSLASGQDCHAVIVTGGTGISSRDTTFEAITGLLDKTIDGFGEIFRFLSYEQIGSAAILSRAVAGVCGSTVVFSIPGSPAAVELAMDKLILPELGHMTWLVRN